MTFTDAFGMKVTYGLGEAVDLNGCVSEVTFGAIHQISVVIDFDALGVPSVSDLTIRNAKLPAGSVILDVYLSVSNAAAKPATTVDIGTVKLNGTAIDADGLAAATALSAGLKVGEGALIDTVVAEDSYIKITPSAVTAEDLGGLKAKLIIEYI